MKIFSTILMLYVLALHFVPCSDHLYDENTSPSSSISRHTEHSHSTDATDHHQHHNQEKDTCTAFCTCSCCGIALSVFHLEFLELEKPFERKIQVPKLFENTLISSINPDSIWLPPKV